MRRLWDYLVLPGEVTTFEARYLRRMNRVALLFFWLHLPVMMIVALLCRTGPMQALSMTASLLAGTTVGYLALGQPRQVSVLFGLSSMCMGGLLVHFGQGAMQIEMHFYFFVLLALLAVFGNPLAILTAAATVATHHLLLFVLLPRSVFNYEASWWAVVVHALFVVLESTAACFVARSFWDNVIGLEKIVAQRTAEVEQRRSEVEQRNAAMRLVLDNVSQGLLTVERDGTLAAEHSAAVVGWLGPVPVGRPFWDYLRPQAARTAEQFQIYWEILLASEDMQELLLDQMPRRMVIEARHFSLQCQPILMAGRLDKVLLVISDVTAEVERERSDAAQRDMAKLVEKLLINRVAFLDFFTDGSALVGLITAEAHEEMEVLKRQIHTLKGNSSTFGLAGIAALCHDIETRIAETGRPPSREEREELRLRWQRFATVVEQVIGQGGPRRIEIEEAEHAALLSGILAGEPRLELARLVRTWTLQPLEARLQHLADQARDLSVRLGKVTVAVQVESGNIRLAKERWAGFLGALSHVVRNAIDHGMETSEERILAGKSQPGQVALRAYLTGGHLVLEVADDGRGINWAKVAERAGRLGLPCESPQELIAALFSDGLSTRGEVTEVSGRGVGMGAVRAACEELGGSIQVSSTAGLGTTLVFTFPARLLGPPGASRPVLAQPHHHASV